MFNKAVICLLLSLGIAANVNAVGNLLKNPGFEDCHSVKGQFLPKSWHSGSWGKDSKKNVYFSVDAKTFHSPKYSAAIKQIDGSNYCHYIQKVTVKPLSTERRMSISAWIKANNAEFGSIVVVADTPQKKAVLWKRLVTFDGTFDWKKITGQVTIPANVKAISLSIRLKGIGKIWIDDCLMSFGSTDTASVALSKNLLFNPGLSGKINKLTGLPPGLEKAEAPGYETVFNAKVISKKTNIVRIDWESGGVKCGVKLFTGRKLSPGKYILRGQCKTLKNSQAVLGVDNALSAAVSGSVWQPVSIIFDVSAKSGGELFCWNIGQGSVEFKDLEVRTTTQQGKAKFPLAALVMPVENTVIWSGEPQVNSFEDAPVPVAFDFKREAAFKQGKLVVDLPRALKITDAYNFYPSYMTPEIPTTVKISKQGVSYRRYTFTNPRIFRILRDKYTWARKLVMAIEPVKPVSQKSFTIFWHLEADGKSSPEQSFKFNLLPPLKKLSMPKKFPIFCWSMKDFCFSDPGVSRRMAVNFERAGIKTRPRILMNSKEYRKIDDLVSIRGWKMFVSNPDYAETKFCNLKKSGLAAKAKLVQYNTGKINPKHLCPTWFNRNKEFKKYLTGFLRDKYKMSGAKNGDIIFYDIEPWSPMTWCFCEDCRKDFGQRNHISGIPSVAEILDKYPEQWSKFRCQQTAESTKLHTEIFRELYPASPVFDYDYAIDFTKPGFNDIFRKVAKDPRLNEKYFDGHLSSYYHYLDQRAFDLISTNIQNLKKDYYVICAIDKLGYLSKQKVLSPVRLRMLLLATAVNGGKGFAIFPGEHIDGTYLKMFNETLHKIAGIEDILSSGKQTEKSLKVKVKEANLNKYLRFRVHELNNKILISLFNYNSKHSMLVRLSLNEPTGKYTLIDVSSKKRIIPANGQSWTATGLKSFVANVKPMSVRLLLVRKYRESDSKLTSISK